MQTGYNADVALGYAQSSAVDSATLISALTFGQAGAPGIPLNTQALLITPQTQAVRWRDDGVAPTATVGYPLPVGSELIYTGSDFTKLQVISQVAGAIVNVLAFGTGAYR